MASISGCRQTSAEFIKPVHNSVDVIGRGRLLAGQAATAGRPASRRQTQIVYRTMPAECRRETRFLRRSRSAILLRMNVRNLTVLPRKFKTILS